jgi:hypothetical protein
MFSSRRERSCISGFKRFNIAFNSNGIKPGQNLELQKLLNQTHTCTKVKILVGS